MVDLQKKRKQGNSGLIVIGAGLAVMALGVGGYFAWGALQDGHVAKQAAAVSKAGMAITRTQAKARVNAVEPGTNLGDWTTSAASPTGFSCDTMVVGSGPIRVWNVCGQEEELIRITIGPKDEPVTADSAGAAALMTRLLDAAAPEVDAAERQALVDALPDKYASGEKARAIVGQAEVTFSTDKDGRISRMIARPAS